MQVEPFGKYHRKMSQVVKFFILLLGILIIGCGTGNDYKTPPIATFEAVVSGKIVNTNGESLPGIAVLIVNDQEISYGSEYTNRKGEFRNHLISGIQDTLRSLTFSFQPLDYHQLPDTNLTVSLDPALILKHSSPRDSVHFEIVYPE